MINGKQNVKLKKGFISFKNYSRRIPVPFKIYADFECILKNVVLYRGKNVVNVFIISIFNEYNYCKKIM